MTNDLLAVRKSLAKRWFVPRQIKSDVDQVCMEVYELRDEVEDLTDQIGELLQENWKLMEGKSDAA